MSVGSLLRRWRDWIPIPSKRGEFHLVRWVLLEGNRLAVTGALLTVVFVVLMASGALWTVEMQRLLTETSTVQDVLGTFLSGMILLVSIVVSINSIVLSHDIASIENQADRITAAMSFRYDLNELTTDSGAPSNPSEFIEVMSEIISERALALSDSVTEAGGEVDDWMADYATSIAEDVDNIGAVTDTSGAQFAVLWMGLEFKYGPPMAHSHSLKSSDDSGFSEHMDDELDSLIEAFELFAIGREYFKTLYYTREISSLSRTLLIVTLPAILFIASTIVAIGAGLLPEVWLLGLPPLHSFVATAFTVSLAPYIVLTSYMLRLSTVARRTASGGLFSLE